VEVQETLGDTMAQVLVWKTIVVKEPGSSGKVWRGYTHVGAITNAMCCTKPDSINNSLTIVREDRRVQRPCLLLPELDDMLRQSCNQSDW